MRNPMREIHAIKRKYPGLAKRQEAGSKAAAIHLFCIECYGGNLNDAQSCPTSDCPLWSAVSPKWRRKRAASVAVRAGDGGSA